MKRLIQILLVCTLLITKLGWSQDANQALEVVESSFSSVLNKLNNNKAEYQSNQQSLFDMINTEILPIVDDKLMARYVLGNNWKSASKKQQVDFVDAFKYQIFKAYGVALLDFSDVTMKYGKPSEVKKKRTKLKLLIESNDGKNYPVELSLRFSKDKWLIYDASLDGLSIIVSLRGSIGDEVNKKGIQTVIDELKK